MIRKIVYILMSLMVLMPSFMMVIPVQASTVTLSVTGESGYTSGITNYQGGLADFTVMNSDDDGASIIRFADSSGEAERAWTVTAYGAVGNVNSVTVYYKIFGGGGFGSAKPFVRIGGVNYYGTLQTVFATWTLYSYTWTTNPATGLAWTTSAINAAYYGLYGTNISSLGYETQSTYYYVVVDYTIVPPTLTTSAATLVTNSTLTLNGAISATGGANAQSEGFVWDTVSHTPLASTNVTPGNGYSSWWYQNGTYGVGAFSKAITGLTSGQIYYFRSAANNTQGWNYGSELTVQTLGQPTVSTLPATSIATTSAQLNALVTSYGGQLCDVRFGYGTTSRAATLAGFAGYDVTTAWVNNTYGTGSTPMVIPTTLTLGTLYYYNVQIENDAGISYGVEGTFTTASGFSAPTNFIAIPNSDLVTLVWTKGTGSSTTYIRYSTSTYPNTTADGTLVYSGALSSFTHTNLTAGTTYYYSAWGAVGVLYSTTAATAMGTTTAGTVTTNITVPTVSSSKWVAMPSELGLSGFPLYPYGNWIADTYSMPRATFWVAGYMMMVLIICMFVYMKAPSNNLLLTGMSGVILLGFGTIPTPALIPIWIPFVFIIVLITIGWVLNRY